MGAGLIFFAILALIGGYFLIKKYNSLDRAFFGYNDPDYETSGLGFVIVGIAIGAVLTIIYAVWSMLDYNQNFHSFINYLGGCLLALNLAIAWFRTLTGPLPISGAIGKTVFLTFTILVGVLMGIAGSFIVLAAVVLYIILAAVSGASSSDSGKKVKASSGDIIDSFFGDKTLTHSGGDEYRDSAGNRYRRDGNDFYKID